MNAAPVAVRRRALLAAAAACAMSTARGRPVYEPALRVALVPYLPPRALLQTWEPLRLHLMAQLGQPVELYSAASFRALIDSVRTRAQELTLVPVHLGQLLAREGAAAWIAISARWSDVQLLTTLAEGDRWDGRRVGVGDPLSILTLIARRWLAEQGLTGRVSVVEGPNPATLALWLARGDVDAIVVSSAQVPDLPPLRDIPMPRAVTLDWILTPGWQVVAGTTPSRRQQLQAALLAYRPDDRGTAETARWIAPDAAQLARYDGLASAAKAVLDGRR